MIRQIAWLRGTVALCALALLLTRPPAPPPSPAGRVPRQNHQPLPTWMSFTRSMGATCEEQVWTLACRLEEYAQNHGGHYPRELKALAAGKRICPAAGRDTYAYSCNDDATECTVCCAGEHHKASGLAANVPRYSSRTGLLEGNVELANDPHVDPYYHPIAPHNSEAVQSVSQTESWRPRNSVRRQK